MLLILLMISSGLIMSLSAGIQQREIILNAASTNGTQVREMLSMLDRSEQQLSSQEFKLFASYSMGENILRVDSALGPPNGMSEAQIPQSSLPIPPIGGAGVFLLQDGQNGPVYVILRLNVESDRLSPTPLVFAPILQVWLDSERRRSRFRIYFEILDALKRGPMTPYEIWFHLRLNPKRTKEYLEFLKKNSFLDCADQGGRTICSITAAGKTFVENLRMALESDK